MNGMNLDYENVGIIIFGNDNTSKEGGIVKCKHDNARCVVVIISP